MQILKTPFFLKFCDSIHILKPYFWLMFSCPFEYEDWVGEREWDGSPDRTIWRTKGKAGLQVSNSLLGGRQDYNSHLT